MALTPTTCFARLRQAAAATLAAAALATPGLAGAELLTLGPLDLTPRSVERSGLQGDFSDRIEFDLLADPAREGLFVRLQSPFTLVPGIDELQTGISGLTLSLLDASGLVLRELSTTSRGETLELAADPNNGSGLALIVSGFGKGLDGGRYRLDLSLIESALPDPDPPGDDGNAVPAPPAVGLVLLGLVLLMHGPGRQRRRGADAQGGG